MKQKILLVIFKGSSLKQIKSFFEGVKQFTGSRRSILVKTNGGDSFLMEMTSFQNLWNHFLRFSEHD